MNSHLVSIVGQRWAREWRDPNDTMEETIHQHRLDLSHPQIAVYLNLCQRVRDLPGHFSQHSGRMVIYNYRATVKGADLHYEGSIGIGKGLMQAAGLLPGEAVHVWNINSGERLQTYALPDSLRQSWRYRDGTTKACAFVFLVDCRSEFVSERSDGSDRLCRSISIAVVRARNR